MELLVQIVDRTNDKDPVLNARLTKAGDVISIRDDGEGWGRDEVANPNYRIIKVPDEKSGGLLAQSLLSPQKPPTLDKQYTLLKARQISLDLKLLDQLTAGKITLDQATKIADIVTMEEQVKLGQVADVDLKAYLKTQAVDADVAIADVQSITILKPVDTTTAVISVDPVVVDPVAP